MRRLPACSVLLLLGLCALPGALRAQPADPPTAERQDFAEARWHLQSGGGHRIETVNGRTALILRNGQAERPDLLLEDGTIDFDLALSERRSFVGIQVRRQATGNAEHFYFRPHKSSLPDALQYTPVLSDNSQWQLFHDESGGAAVTFPDWEWGHVRIVLAGDRAAVFYGSMERPVLVVDHLALAPTAGFLRLTAGAPGLSDEEPDFAAFANLDVRPGWIPFEFPERRAKELPEGLIAEWAVSPAFAASPESLTEPPAAALAGPWQAAAAERDGRVMLSRYLERPPDAPWWGTLARLELTANEAKRVALELGFSDNATVFLNGKPLFSGRYSYSYELPSRMGLISFDQATVYLPLEKGRNDLAVVVTERFGGWAVMGRLLDGAGVTVRAPH
jgi:hypothetical protein